MNKGIPTKYGGVQFRSRVEAHWAAYFDHIEEEWLYEPRKFRTEHGGYLPDFYLPRCGVYAEVKAQITPIDPRWSFVAKQTDAPMVLLFGTPYQVHARPCGAQIIEKDGMHDPDNGFGIPFQQYGDHGILRRPPARNWEKFDFIKGNEYLDEVYFEGMHGSPTRRRDERPRILMTGSAVIENDDYAWHICSEALPSSAIIIADMGTYGGRIGASMAKNSLSTSLKEYHVQDSEHNPEFCNGRCGRSPYGGNRCFYAQQYMHQQMVDVASMVYVVWEEEQSWPGDIVMRAKERDLDIDGICCR